MAKPQIIFQAVDIHKTYLRGKITVEALAGVSLEITKNDYIAIMGPSGSGKSTLMHILGCLDTPTSGEYYLEDRLVSRLSDDELALVRSQFIGFVFQNFSLLPRLSALDNVALPLIYTKNTRRDQIAKARQILQKVGLADRIFHRPNELSGGECQRVAIGRALVNNPKIIFADEPTGNLDSKTGAEIMEIFDGLIKEGNTIVLVTHDANIAGHAKKTISLKDGLVVNG